MNVRTLIVLGAFVALVVPATAPARLIPVKHPGQYGGTNGAKRHVVPRNLCICVTTTSVGLPRLSEADLEAQIDADMIAHGLEPLYGQTAANIALEIQYDAYSRSLGLSPVYPAASAG